MIIWVSRSWYVKYAIFSPQRLTEPQRCGNDKDTFHQPDHYQTEHRVHGVMRTRKRADIFNILLGGEPVRGYHSNSCSYHRNHSIHNNSNHSNHINHRIGCNKISPEAATVSTGSSADRVKQHC